MNFTTQKRILVFNDGLNLGGTEKLLLRLLNYLVEKKYKVTLLLPQEDSDDVLLPEVNKNVQVIYLYPAQISRLRRKWYEVKMIFRTKSFLKQCKISESEYDQVICFKEGLFAKMFSAFSIPKILWLHNIFYSRTYEATSLKNQFGSWLNKKEIEVVQNSYSLYSKVVCVSDACKQSYLNIVFDGCMPIQDIRVLPNGVDLDEILELSKEELSLDLPTIDTKFILLTRNSPDKRVDRIIQASRRLQQEGYKFKVLVLGINSSDDSVREEIENRDLQDVIQFYGKAKNPYPYIKQSDWVICVSERESFSLALLEGMALGVPVVTTDCGGPTNLIEGGKYGLLVENSTKGVYQGMKTVLEDSLLSERYRLNLENIVKCYDIKYWLRSIDKLL